MNRTRSHFFLGTLLCLIITSVLLVRNNDSRLSSIAGNLSARKPNQSPERHAEVDVSGISDRSSSGSAAHDTEVFVIGSGSSRESIVLALDEAVVRDENGMETLVPLRPAATRETLPSRLRALSAAKGVFPVAYLLDQPRTDATRRLITNDLRVEADESMTHRLLSSHAVTLHQRPAYAPNWVILKAADPFVALEIMKHMREQQGMQTADVLLASQRARRAMPNDPLITNQWHYKNATVPRTHMNMEAAWKFGASGGVKGAGIRIGIVDDGLQTAHPDLTANVDTVNDKDWNGNDSDPNPGTGDDHGTACAGNAAAKGNNSLGVSGSAPDATLVGMRLIAASVTDAQEAEAMSYLPGLIPILSNSWGPNDTGNIVEEPGPLTRQALLNATTTGRGNKGTIILWAAGNGGDVGDNSNYDGYANSIHTIAIGATDSSGNRAYYSEPGSNLVVCAPSSGVLGITTVDRTGTNGYNTASSASGGDYANDFGGTSSATPSAAGVVALMLEKNPNLGWRDVQEILIRSAFQFQPTDSDWVTNAAGIRFNHNFGAGLIDADAAVNLAATWTNLAAQTTIASTAGGLPLGIPENNATGITHTFSITDNPVRVEHVTVRLNINHTSRGNLEITLTSPSGMVSRLTAVHSDSNDNYANWTFSSVRHWGENSTGTWTLRIADRSTTGNTTGGSLTSAQLTLFGTAAATSNPPPAVAITQPTDGQTFSPNSSIPVAVSASDFTGLGTAGVIDSVSLLVDGSPIGTDSTAPYTFNISPAVGNRVLVARATDSEGASNDSAPVGISIVNQPPVISALTLSASGNVYADETVGVSSVTASDPENQSLTIQYQWQFSSDGSAFTDAPLAQGVSLGTDPGRAGKLWRCRVRVSDGTNTSEPFLSAAVQMLARPVLTASAGTSYQYQSGLVLRGTGSALSRSAMIQEFSQGSATGEWVEILTLVQGSFRNWSLADNSASRLRFAATTAWDNIPAGTLIVIYNGTDKDTLLGADDSDPSDGKMILSSANTTFFSGTPVWPALGNSGDAVILRDAADAIVSRVSYGNETSSPPNVGAVGTGKSAYYFGSDDAGSLNASQWLVTSSTVARSRRALTPAVSLASGSYSQDFSVTPGASGTAYPNGWTCYNGTTEDPLMAVGSSISDIGGNYNYGSRLGLLGSGSNFDTGSLVMAIANTTSLSNLTISFDVVKIREQGRSHDFILEYSTTSPTSGFTPVPNATYVSGTIAQNTVTSFANIALPAVLNNLSSTVYLRWLYQPSSSPGSGSRDGLALDNVQLLASGTVAPSLQLIINPSSFAENAGAAAATGTVSVAVAPTTNLTITLSSSSTNDVTVPGTVTIPAGQVSASFSLTAIDDALVDGVANVSISAETAGYLPASSSVTVTDNEAPLEGVTPANANSPGNFTFVTSLRSGTLNNPSLFRWAAGVQVPDGLSLSAGTGLISGTIAAHVAAGPYPLTIERYNALNEVVSQSFILTVTAPASNSYASWIALYPVNSLNALSADPDGDGVANGIENLFGTSPSVGSQGLNEVSAAPGQLIFEHSRSNTPSTDLALSYEWSSNLQQWHPSGATSSGTTVTFQTTVMVDATAPANDIVRVTATASGSVPGRLYARAKATQNP